jgi:hypothetical protein
LRIGRERSEGKEAAKIITWHEASKDHQGKTLSGEGKHPEVTVLKGS